MSYNLLKGKKGIVFGALDERSIAWRTALKCHEEGAQLVLSNAPVALRMGELNKLAEAVKAPVIGADVTNMDDLKKLFEESMKHFGGGIDFVLHSIGMSLNVRKGKSYTEIDYELEQEDAGHIGDVAPQGAADGLGPGCVERRCECGGVDLYCRTAVLSGLQ